MQTCAIYKEFGLISTMISHSGDDSIVDHLETARK